MNLIKKLEIFLLVAIHLTGCINLPIDDSGLAQGEQGKIPENIGESEQYKTPISHQATRSFALTYQGLNGNRVCAGHGGKRIESMDIKLRGKPIWIVSSAQRQSSVWYVILENGQVQSFLVSENSFQEFKPSVESLPSGMPPVLITDEQGLYLADVPENASVLTHSALLHNGTEVFIDNAQKVYIKSEEGEYFLDGVQAIPDARILTDGNGRILFLSDPSDNYTHGVLGDVFEATSITLLDLQHSPLQIRRIVPEVTDVFEGIAPIWMDINLDGMLEIIVTQSNEMVGARIVIYREDGSILAESAPVGKGFRWMHQIAAAQFVSGEMPKLAIVKTPHINGEIIILGLFEDRLEVIESLSGYSSHRLGSRNLDAALAADFNGDGIIELIVPNQAQDALSGIQFISGDLNSVWTQSLDSDLSSNLACVYLENQSMLLGAGTEDGLLKILISN